MMREADDIETSGKLGYVCVENSCGGVLVENTIVRFVD